MLFQKIKLFLLKENVDLHRADNKNLYNFHPQMRVFLAVNGIFFHNKDTLLRLIWPAICIALSFVAIGMELMFICHGLATEDYSFATECFCYTIIVGCIPVVYLGLLSSRQKIYDILEDMNEDFLVICRLGDRHKKAFLEGQLLIWQLCFAWFTFMCFVGGMYILFPVAGLLYQGLFVTQDEHMDRPLLFPVWLPEDDPYRTPNYEIFLLLEIILILTFIQTFCVYIYTLFHILLHHYTIMDMIALSFESIFDGLDESVVSMPGDDPRRVDVQRMINRRVGKIVRWHLSVFKAVRTVSSVYGPVLVYQVMLSSIAICLIAYQIAENLDQGKLDILFCLLGIAACMQMWIPCYLGTLIRNKAFAVGDACWGCGWHETPLGTLLRPHIVFIIMRSQEPLTIKFIGLPNVQLETFSSIMTTAYSYFNMLRQYSHSH